MGGITDSELLQGEFADFSLSYEHLDPEIAKAYKQIYTAIDEWSRDVVDENALDGLLKNFSQEAAEDKAQLKRQLLIQKGIESTSLEDPVHRSYLAVSVAIRDHIQKQIWDQSYPLGVTKAERRRIDQHCGDNDTEETDGLEGSEDKSEALRTLTVQDHFLRNQGQKVMQVSELISRDFGCWGFEIASHDHLSNGLHDICKQAALLHTKFHCSISDYRIRRPVFDPAHHPSDFVDAWTFRDFDQWSDMTTGFIYIGFRITCLHPSLIKVLGEVKHIMVLYKPVVVVKTYDEKWWASLGLPEEYMLD